MNPWVLQDFRRACSRSLFLYLVPVLRPRTINLDHNSIPNSLPDIFKYSCWNRGIYLACTYFWHSEIVHFMISKGSEFDHLELSAACESGNIELAHLSIQRSNISDYSWELGCACFKGNLELAQLMIDKGAEPDWGFLQACRGGYIELVQLMMQNNLCYNNYNIYREGFKEACYYGHLDVVNLITKKMDSINWNEGLEAACAGGKQNLVTLAIAQGATYCYHCMRHNYDH